MIIIVVIINEPFASLETNIELLGSYSIFIEKKKKGKKNEKNRKIRMSGVDKIKAINK